jgi:uncharacterized protein YndB with AHSA1/START domain
VSLAASVEVDRAPEDVFAYVTDPSRFAEWQDGVVGGHMEGGGPTSVGDRCVTTRRIAFAERPVHAEVTHVDPPRTWGVRGLDGPVRATVDVTVDALDGGRRSRVTITIDFRGHGIGVLLVPLVVRPQASTEMPATMQRRKARLEAPARPGR